MIQTLIDKEDNFELVGKQIASILASEVASQKALAIAAQKNPAPWDLRVYHERFNSFENYLNGNDNKTPIVNVSFDSLSYNGASSDTVERQKAEAIYNIDCCALGVSSGDDFTGGHTPGDKEATFNLHRVLRLVRNILMASEYTYLGLRGIVWSRMPQSITVSHNLTENNMQKIIVGRISLNVSFNEFSPQYIAQNLEILAIDVKRQEDGEIIAQAEYNYA